MFEINVKKIDETKFIVVGYKNGAVSHLIYDFSGNQIQLVQMQWVLFIIFHRNRPGEAR